MGTPRFIAPALIAAALLPSVSWAQTAITPLPTRGCGVMSVTTSSTTFAAANITLCTNSAALPAGTSTQVLRIKVQSNSSWPVIVCKLGGTCATGGEYIAVGESVTQSLVGQDVANQPPTLIGVGGTATVYVEWN